MKKIKKICDLDRCTGCSVCESVCPTKSITMGEQHGFYRPIINTSCVGCDTCKKMCPANNLHLIDEKKNNQSKIVYAAWDKNNIQHKLSTSGGIAYLIAENTVCNNGFVVAACFNINNQIVEHVIIDHLDELQQIRGSKYVNSKKTRIYEKVIDLLTIKDGVFFGVPCEVYAMKLIYDNKKEKMKLHKLIFVDLLCHGGASPLYFSKHIKNIIGKKRIDSVSFRGGEYDCNFCVYQNGNLVYRDGQFQDSFFRLFMKRSLYQPACFDCKFVGEDRVGDITLGDYWGICESIEEQSDVQGINLVIVNNIEGQRIFQSIKDKCRYYERSMLEAKKENDTLSRPTQKPNEYNYLWQLLEAKGYNKAIKKVYGINETKRIIFIKFKFFIKKIVRR